MNPTELTVLDPSSVRDDFPILSQTIHNNKPLIYLDNGASTQRPLAVIEAMNDCYKSTYANVHRGIHYLSERASEQYESARKKVATFIGAQNVHEVIFTSGTTAAINLIAYAWGGANISAGDEIVLTIMEHHSNIVPWQMLAERTGAKIRWVNLNEDGRLDIDQYKNLLNEKTKLVSFCAVSNVLGTINDVVELTSMAHQSDAKVFVDAAQHVPHDHTDVAAWDADFVTFSGHKIMGPSGIGILYGKRELLESMPAFLGGGSMISSVTTDGYALGELPAKFEAGTPPIVEAIGLAAALDYLGPFDMKQILAHEQMLATETIARLNDIAGIQVLGPSDGRAGIVSFHVDGVSNQDLSIFLDRQGVAIRAGHHCAMPLHDYLGIRNSSRASFYLYNTLEDVEIFHKAMVTVVEKLR